MIEIVYILGSTRSGTSALRNGLCQTRFTGYGEGHLVPILRDIIGVVDRHKTEGLGSDVAGNGLYRMDRDAMLRHLFRGYERYLSTRFKKKKGCVVDKTPTLVPIQAAPDLNRFHSTPHFIYCARRHLDNVQSKIRKFPGQSLEQHCREWVKCNESWLEVRERMNGNYLAFDFHDMATDPMGVATRIGSYLSLTAEDTAGLGAYLVSKRPQTTEDRDLTQFLRLSDIDWTDEDKDTFVRICGPLGDRLGYGMEEYFQTTGQPEPTGQVD